MSTSQDLVIALKAELKQAGITYADLAQQLGLAHSSVKRILASGDMPLSRVDEICRVLRKIFGHTLQALGEGLGQVLPDGAVHEQQHFVVTFKAA